MLQHVYDKQEVIDPRLTAAQHCTKAQCYVHKGDKPDRRARFSTAGKWNVDALTGRAGKVAKVLTKDVSLLLQGKVYDACVCSCTLCGSETWSLKRNKKIRNSLALCLAEIGMIRWMWCENKGQTILCRIKAAVRNGRQ